MANQKLSPEDQNRLMKGPSKKNTEPKDFYSDFTLEKLDSFGDRESLKNMVTHVKNYNSMLAEQITFINTPLSAAIPFTRENLYLICAYTGNGKSTIAANISYPLWKEKKKILIITNEETESDVLFRISCLDLNLSFNDWKKGLMGPDDQLRVMQNFPTIAQYVKVVDVNAGKGMTTKIEGIKQVLTEAKGGGYSCALIDYYQLVKYSLADHTRSTYDVLNDLRTWLGTYIKGCEIPVVLFAQLYSMGKRQSKDIDARIKECTAVNEPATVIIEAIPNMDELTTDFIIHKDRFGYAGMKITCAFEKGRYVRLTEEHKRRVTELKLNKLTKDIADLSKPILVDGGGRKDD